MMENFGSLDVRGMLYPASVNIALVFWATIAYNVDKLCLWI